MYKEKGIHFTLIQNQRFGVSFGYPVNTMTTDLLVSFPLDIKFPCSISTNLKVHDIFF